MNIHRAFMVAGLLVFISGCYVPMTGRVIDAETQQPIEGAVVLVEWTKTHSLGDHWTESYKVVETVSDKEGKVKLEGCFCPFTNPPDVTVYKKGYVAWNSRMIFPGWKPRTDFRWGNYLFRLDNFKDEFSFVDHDGFVSRAINDTIGWENKKMFMKAYYDAVEGSLIRERNERDKKRMGGPKQ